MNKWNACVVALVVGAGWLASAGAEPGEGAAGLTLREAAGDRMLIGAAVAGHFLDDPAYASLVARQYSSVTAENEMKPSSMLTGRWEYDFSAADRIVAFAQRHGMEVIGHTLVWHAQSPRWLYETEGGEPLPREQALANMRRHITTVMHHFKGRVKGWDVVNEAVPDGPGDLRDTPAYRAIGDDYVLKAFEFAHAADPDAELYYNDYNIDQDYKRDRALKLVKRVRDAGLRIDGVGIQGHYLLKAPPIEEVRRGVRAYTQAGFDVMISELDVDPLPRRGGAGADLGESERAGLDPYREGLPPAVERELAERYRELFALFVSEPRVKRVTLWGVTDGHSWLNNFPVRGRTNHALLFDRGYRPKAAFGAVVQTLQGAASARAVGQGASLTAPLRWESTGELILPPRDAERPVVSIKDPSVVFHEGLWHVIATVARPEHGWQLVYLSFKDWDQAKHAEPHFLDRVNPGLAGYRAAPQVFWFEPHRKWYLVFQSQQPQYSTTDDISDPASWSEPRDFFDGKPATAPDLWIDYFVICDDTHAYLFFTGDNGKLYRSRTALGRFPAGMSEPEVVLEDENRFNLFEGSAHYKLKGTGRYLTLIEAIGPGGRRWYRAWTSDRLDGVWEPLADTWDNPFASINNVTFAPGVEVWTDDISHGELIRESPDQTMLVDPENLRLLYQGQKIPAERTDYIALPYRLGILRLIPGGAGG